MGIATTVRQVRLSDPEKQTQTTLDTVELTKALISTWHPGPFQRPIRINDKVLAARDEIRRTCVIPGVITIGVLDGAVYIVDGQHRLKAFELAECEPVYCDVRKHWFTSMGEMADEFVKLNSSLVKMRPDDLLRGMEPSEPALAAIRKACPFVGYDMIRRSERAPIVSMGTVIRMWLGSRTEVPTSPTGSTKDMLVELTDREVEHCIKFLNLCFEAWRRDIEYQRLWNSLNFSLCAWMFRRLVLESSPQTKRATHLTIDEFRMGLLALSADSGYIDYLAARKLCERDRNPTYDRIKKLFSRRIAEESGRKLVFPKPAWAHG